MTLPPTAKQPNLVQLASCAPLPHSARMQVRRKVGIDQRVLEGDVIMD